MAKKSMLEREKKRSKLSNKKKDLRIELKVIIKKSTDYEKREQAQLQLAKLPRDSSPVRGTKRCQQCGRPHAVYRKFGLCRICLRQQLMTGNVTGGRKSSW